MSDDEKKPEPQYGQEAVANALQVTVDITLDRVLKGLSAYTYGTEIEKKKNGEPKVKIVIDWDDVIEVLDELRGPKPEDEDE